LLVSPGNEAELASAMLRLAEDARMRERMGDAARSLAKELSADASARGLAELYRNLANQH
jgi:glycosyltransferase involved in cell wall biosynthesis